MGVRLVREIRFQPCSPLATGPEMGDWAQCLPGTMPQMVERTCATDPVEHMLPGSGTETAWEALCSPAARMR